MNRYAGAGLAVLAVASITAPPAAEAEVWSPPGCATTAPSTWGSNCWVGYSYEENGHYVVAAQTVARLYPQNAICFVTRGLERDGVFGQSTKDAVKLWQYGTGSQSGSGYGASLTPDGIVGSATWSRFRDVVAAGYDHMAGNYKFFKNDAFPVSSSCVDTVNLRPWFAYGIAADQWYVLMPGGTQWEVVSVS